MEPNSHVDEKLDLINERLDELEETIIAIRHAQKMAVFWRILYYLFLIGIGVGLFVWAKPYVQKAQDGLIQLQDSVKKVQTNINTVKEKTQQFQDFLY